VIAAVALATVVAGSSRGVPSSAARPSVPSGSSRVGDDPFAGLPLVVPGQLVGRIRYIANGGCKLRELRELDLATGRDSTVASFDLCDVGWAVLSPAGDAVAARRGDNRIVLTRVDGTKLAIGEPARGRPPGNFNVLPTFSSTGRLLAYCGYTKTRMVTSIVDVPSGKVLAHINGTCEVAFTARGIAYVKRTSLIIAGKTIFRFPGTVTANTVAGIGSEGNPLISNPDGNLLALATRDHGAADKHVTIHILRLDGSEVARYRGSVDITLAFQALAPAATSAFVWWGDIMQLASFGRPHGSFTLRYHAGHSTDASRAIFPSTYAPDGVHAIMPRTLLVPGEPQPAPLPALILSASDLAPEYRLSIDAQIAVWLPPQ